MGNTCLVNHLINDSENLSHSKELIPWNQLPGFKIIIKAFL